MKTTTRILPWKPSVISVSPEPSEDVFSSTKIALPATAGSEGAAELAPSGIPKDQCNGQEKITRTGKILNRVLGIRLTDAAFQRLEKITKSSDYRTIGEAARKIMSKEKITLFYKDITLNSATEELALIRKELRAIEININQVTKAFRCDKRKYPQQIQVGKMLKLYQTVEEKNRQFTHSG